MASPNVKIKPFDPDKDLKPDPSNYVEKIPQVEATPDEFRKPLGQAENDDFLKAIRMLESSGGKNTDHETMESGLHAGDTAMGSFGLMPNTAKDIASKLNHRNTTLRNQVGADYEDPEVQQLARLPKDKIDAAIKRNPDLENALARYLAKHLNATHNGDLSKMAYGWNAGSNLPPEEISDQDLANSEYVSRFKDLYARENKPEGLGPVYSNQDILDKATKLQAERSPATPRFQNLTKDLKKNRK